MKTLSHAVRAVLSLFTVVTFLFTSVRAQENLPDPVTDSTSARLPGEPAGNPVAAQKLLQTADLRGLARSLDPLEGDEEGLVVLQGSGLPTRPG